LAAYEIDEKVLATYAEFSFANNLFWAIAEGNAAELASRRTAMENATKNAGDMITNLTLTYNRRRQAAITNELCDIIIIITGAMAL
jgi:F-type H+-transporting ATPase subunit gamma